MDLQSFVSALECLGAEAFVAKILEGEAEFCQFKSTLLELTCREGVAALLIRNGKRPRVQGRSCARSILNTSVFTIEPGSVMCGIFQDITKPIFQKEQIIGRAREVIQKNLQTVQQIAFLLGENAADSEIILNSIVRSFSPEEVDDKDGGAQQ